MPRDKISGKYLFPSSPTFLERLEMARSGYDPETGAPPFGLTTRVSVRRFNEDSRLAAGIVYRNVYGLRSDVKLPEKFFGYFRYCNGFSILTAPRIIPVGLARFLASIWVTDPHSLWLSRPETLKQCLRRIPVGILNSIGDDSDFSFESDSEEE
jgi:hypothetical protein